MGTGISIVLMLAVFPLLAAAFQLISRIMKKLREKDGGAVLRENRRLAAAWTAACVCFVAGTGLFDYSTKENASVLRCLINGGKNVLLPVVCLVIACHTFQKRGIALQEKNRSN